MTEADSFQPRKVLSRRPPRGDPPALDLTRLRSSTVQERLSEILLRNPGWFVDPPAEDFLNVRILDLIRRWRAVHRPGA